MTDQSTLLYRRSELAKVLTQSTELSTVNIKISAANSETKWLNITRDELLGLTKSLLHENTTLSDADILTQKLINAGADRAKVIAIIDGYGDPVDWNYHSLDSIVAEVWQSDLNSGDEPDGWIINEICRSFNVEEVTE